MLPSDKKKEVTKIIAKGLAEAINSLLKADDVKFIKGVFDAADEANAVVEAIEPEFTSTTVEED
jgi:hypothetical protein